MTRRSLRPCSPHERRAQGTREHRRLHRRLSAGDQSDPGEDPGDDPEAAPDAVETISYQIPTFTLGGNLVYFAAFKNHIGLYPPVRSDEKLRAEASVYANDKGNLRFPLDERIPYALIGRIVKARVRENREKNELRQKKPRARTARS